MFGTQVTREEIFWDYTLNLQCSLAQIKWFHVAIMEYLWRDSQEICWVFIYLQTGRSFSFWNTHLMLFFCSKTFSGFLWPEGYGPKSSANQWRTFASWPQCTSQPPFSTTPQNMPIEKSCYISSTPHTFIEVVILCDWLPSLLFSWGYAIHLPRPRSNVLLLRED